MRSHDIEIAVLSTSHPSYRICRKLRANVKKSISRHGYFRINKLFGSAINEFNSRSNMHNYMKVFRTSNAESDTSSWLKPSYSVKVSIYMKLRHFAHHMFNSLEKLKLHDTERNQNRSQFLPSWENNNSFIEPC